VTSVCYGTCGHTYNNNINFLIVRSIRLYLGEWVNSRTLISGISCFVCRSCKMKDNTLKNLQHTHFQLMVAQCIILCQRNTCNTRTDTLVIIGTHSTQNMHPLHSTPVGKKLSIFHCREMTKCAQSRALVGAQEKTEFHILLVGTGKSGKCIF
jgi:hypothetical protein